MRRSATALVAVCLSLLVTDDGAIAAPLPAGTISCVVAGDPGRPNGDWRLRFLPPIASTPRENRIRVFTYMTGTCDNSGVTGGKAPITNVSAHLIGRLAEGTTCEALTTAPVFEKLKLKIKWQSNDGRLRTVASTSVRFVDADWDGNIEGLVFLSTPLKGAFAGSLATITLVIDSPEVFDSGICDPTGVDGAAYGTAGGSSIVIQ